MSESAGGGNASAVGGIVRFDTSQLRAAAASPWAESPKGPPSEVMANGFVNSPSAASSKMERKREQRDTAVAFLQPTRVSAGQRKGQAAEPKGHLNVKIFSVPDIYSHTRVLVGMIANVWNWNHTSTSLYRQILPGLAKVHCGNETYIVPGHLLQDLDTLNLVPASSLHGQIAVSNAHVAEVRLRHASPYFPQVIVLLKLRWLLRLHSACCELDYKMCSFRHLILGLQYVVLQQHAEAYADNIFDSKILHSAGAHLNLESVLDDVTDQLHRAMGSAWRGFLEFVATCDPSRAVHSSAMEQTAKIVSNGGLSAALDIVFVANFLRQPRTNTSGRLRELYEDLEALGMQLPELPPLRKAANLRAWSKALSRPSRREVGEKVSRKDLEKLAQLDAVLLTAAVELHLPEVIATPEEAEEMGAVENAASISSLQGGDVAPRAVEIVSTGRSLGSAAPPAARVPLVDRPQASSVVISSALICVHHHLTFPSGIRERLYNLLAEEYGLSRENSERLAIAATQNIDGKRLPEATLLEMEAREKARLLDYGVRHHKDTSHLLISSLVAAPVEKGKPARYLHNHASGISGNRSLPDLRRPQLDHFGETLGRTPFKVPLQTGPLTMDYDTKKLRTTGFFMKMPPLQIDAESRSSSARRARKAAGGGFA